MSASPPEESIIRLKPGLDWQAVDDEIVALDSGTAKYLGVNETGALLWPLVVVGTTEAGLADELVRRFGIDPEQARADVGVFMEQLRSLSLLTEG